MESSNQDLNEEERVDNLTNDLMDFAEKLTNEILSSTENLLSSDGLKNEYVQIKDRLAWYQ